MFDDDMIYGGSLEVSGLEGDTTYFSIAYKTGYWATGNITIEKPGIYVSNNNVDNAMAEWLQFDWNEIHPIDLKYIPDTYATKDELNTLASQISSLNTTLENTLEGADS